MGSGEINPKQQRRFIASDFGIGFLRAEQAGIPTARSFASDRAREYRSRHCGTSDGSTERSCDLHMAGFATAGSKNRWSAVDCGLQHAVRDELLAAKEKFKDKPPTAITDVRTGEILSSVGADYDPKNPAEANTDAH